MKTETRTVTCIRSFAYTTAVNFLSEGPPVVAGERYKMLREFRHSGEGWYLLETKDGVVLNCPDVFFSD